MNVPGEEFVRRVLKEYVIALVKFTQRLTSSFLLKHGNVQVNILHGFALYIVYEIPR